MAYNKNNTGLLKLMLYLNDINNEVHGFSLENTENGFILNLIVHRHLPSEGIIKLDPVFSFEDKVTYEDVVYPILAAMKLKRP